MSVANAHIFTVSFPRECLPEQIALAWTEVERVIYVFVSAYLLFHEIDKVENKKAPMGIKNPFGAYILGIFRILFFIRHTRSLEG